MLLKKVSLFLPILSLTITNYGMYLDSLPDAITEWTQDQKETLIVGACYACNVEAVKEYLKYIQTPFSKDGGEDALFAVIKGGATHPDSPAIIEALAKKIDLNYGRSLTPLHEVAVVAAKTGNLALLQAFLNNGADPDRKGLNPIDTTQVAQLSSCELMILRSIQTDAHTNLPYKAQVVDLLRNHSTLYNHHNKNAPQNIIELLKRIWLTSCT